ncbi:hypothetical protein Ldro_1810 [Legionella drozanskii LLAP-1]|uniref:Uncharacterized protein n=1 Tax=Legionella drozanskii LLAP-1 TaxID=1212489 RepID=A0A0W0SUV8_9GAMM|nr:hypothetical protein Ldro_1810 [Legionella drozanskii LLAP-1]
MMKREQAAAPYIITNSSLLSCIKIVDQCLFSILVFEHLLTSFRAKIPKLNLLTPSSYSLYPSN